MIKKLTRHGNGVALVLDEPLLEQLGADAETSFDVAIDGPMLILTPVKDVARREAFTSALERVNERYPEALKKLAE